MKLVRIEPRDAKIKPIRRYEYPKCVKCGKLATCKVIFQGTGY